MCALSRYRSLFPLDKVPATLEGTCCGLPLAAALLMKIVQVLGGCDCGGKVILDVESVSPRGEIDRRVLTADVDAGLGLIPCVRKWFSQMARLPSFWRSGTRVLLIPASGREVGVVCGGEEQNDEKVSGAPRSAL